MCFVKPVLHLGIGFVHPTKGLDRKNPIKRDIKKYKIAHLKVEGRTVKPLSVIHRQISEATQKLGTSQGI